MPVAASSQAVTSTRTSITPRGCLRSKSVTMPVTISPYHRGTQGLSVPAPEDQGGHPQAGVRAEAGYALVGPLTNEAPTSRLLVRALFVAVSNERARRDSNPQPFDP